jgi:hypothetical protein
MALYHLNGKFKPIKIGNGFMKLVPPKTPKKETQSFRIGTTPLVQFSSVQFRIQTRPDQIRN